jgi:hypothetical protein
LVKTILQGGPLQGGQIITIAEMMQATNWQQHSVRGFLAGTVKKKLRFTLTSAKVEGDVRRYRIDTKRSR